MLVHGDSLIRLPFKGNVLGEDFGKIICGGVDSGMIQNLTCGQVSMLCGLILVVHFVFDHLMFRHEPHMQNHAYRFVRFVLEIYTFRMNLHEEVQIGIDLSMLRIWRGVIV